MGSCCCHRTSKSDKQELWLRTWGSENSHVKKIKGPTIHYFESKLPVKQANPSHWDDQGFSAKKIIIDDLDSVKVLSEKKNNSMEIDLIVPAYAAKKTVSILPRVDLLDRRSFLMQRKVCKRKPVLTDTEEPIPISSFGELSHRKPLKLISCELPCSLRITDQYFELFWAQANSVSSASTLTNSRRIRKRSIQCNSHMVWISGSVTLGAKALILHPSKLIVSICGVEQGLARGIGGLLRIRQPGDLSQRTGNDGPRYSGLSNTSNISIDTLTPPWFACEGFLLDSTLEEAKRVLSKFFIKDIVDELWEFLPEFRFKDRAQINISTEHQDESKLEENKALLKPFSLVANSETELTLSNIDLEAYVHSNVDARLSSIHLSKLNGHFMCPDRLPAHLRKKLLSKFLSQKDQILLRDKPRKEGGLSWSLSNITLCGDKDHESNDMRGVAFRHSLSKGNNLLFSRETLKIPPDQNSPTTAEIDRHLNVSEMGKHSSVTYVVPDSSVSNSFTIFTLGNIQNSKSLSPDSPGYVKLTEGGNHSMPVVTACTKKKDSRRLHAFPVHLLTDVIYDFEEQIMDAVLTALTSEDNQCLITKPVSVNTTKSEAIISGDCDRYDIQTIHLLRPPVKTEVPLKGMDLLLRPERASTDNSNEVTINFSKDLEDTDERKSNYYVRKSGLFVQSLLPPDLEFSYTDSTNQSSTTYDDSYI